MWAERKPSISQDVKPNMAVVTLHSKPYVEFCRRKKNFAPKLQELRHKFKDTLEFWILFSALLSSIWSTILTKKYFFVDYEELKVDTTVRIFLRVIK